MGNYFYQFAVRPIKTFFTQYKRGLLVTDPELSSPKHRSETAHEVLPPCDTPLKKRRKTGIENFCIIRVFEHSKNEYKLARRVY